MKSLHKAILIPKRDLPGMETEALVELWYAIEGDADSEGYDTKQGKRILGDYLRDLICLLKDEISNCFFYKCTLNVFEKRDYL